MAVARVRGRLEVDRPSRAMGWGVGVVRAKDGSFALVRAREVISAKPSKVE